MERSHVSDKTIEEMIVLRNKILYYIQELSKMDMKYFYNDSGTDFKVLINGLQNIWYGSKNKGILNCVSMDDLRTSDIYTRKCRDYIVLGTKSNTSSTSIEYIGLFKLDAINLINAIHRFIEIKHE